MEKLLDGKIVASAIKAETRKICEDLKGEGSVPALGILRVGERKDDISYEKGVKRACEEVGMLCHVYALPVEVSMQELLQTLDEMNQDPKISGILVFNPLPAHLDIAFVKHFINPKKDIDGMSPFNGAKLYGDESDAFAPCTAAAVMEILKYYDIELKGKHVVVLGRSMVVGKPLSLMLLKEDATVTICHSKTKNLEEMTQRADILVAAIGKSKFVGAKHVKPGAIVVDVGIHVDAEGKMCGDVDFEAVKDSVEMITPVPGGVGSVTTSILLKHTIQAAKKA